MGISSTIVPLLMALASVLWVDVATRRRGLEPPWFQVPPGADPTLALAHQLRRVTALGLLGLVFWFGVFLPLGSIGAERQIDLSQLRRFDLFLLHLLLVVCLGVWYVCGFLPRAKRGDVQGSSRCSAQLGFRTDSVLREVAIGLSVGVGAWLVVIGALLAIGVAIWWLGGEDFLPEQPPEIIPWIAALPVSTRLLISLSAGVVEETFFRGFLQPRTGLVFSTVLFVIAHASYEQPFMLLGVTMLSLIYGGLVIWRQSIWSAIAAHAFFDAVQLLVVIPAALRVLPADSGVVVLRILGSG